jgi:multimeric flavodoxin WrbA
MKISVFVAGTNEKSNADFLADAFITGIKEVQDTEITKVRLKDVDLEHFDMKFYKENTEQEKDFNKMKELILSSDGCVFASPIWNFSVPAHLKNFIDRIGSFGLDTATRSLGTLNGKPFYLLYTGGSPTAVWIGLQKKTVSHIPTSLRYFGASVVGSHYEERCTKGKGVFDLVLDQRPGSMEIVQSKGKNFAKVVQHFTKTGRLPFAQRCMLLAFKLMQKTKKRLGI